MQKLKVDTMKTFRTNEELYAQFVMRTKLRKQKVYERINELMLEDLQKPFEIQLSPSQQHKLMFEDIPEIINEKTANFESSPAKLFDDPAVYLKISSAEEECSEEQSA